MKKLIQTGGAYFLDYFTTNVTMSTQYIDMLKAWWRHLEFPNWIFHISNISIIVTTWRSFSSKLYSLYFLSTKNAFQCCPHWKQRVQLSTLHTKVRSYILHIFLFETWFDSGSVGKTTWLGTRRRRTPTSTTPPRGWRGPAWSRHPFQVSPFCSHSVSFVLIRSHLFSFCLMIKLYRRRGGGTCF